jgi:hypothetical protein
MRDLISHQQPAIIRNHMLKIQMVQQHCERPQPEILACHDWSIRLCTFNIQHNPVVSGGADKVTSPPLAHET